MENIILEMVARQNKISEALKNPSKLYNELYANNPAFRQFVKENEGKSIDQIANEHGIDLEELRKSIR